MLTISELHEKYDLILTDTALLARDFQVRYGMEKRQQGHSVWRKPAIACLRHWLSASWANCWPNSQRLHPVQEMMLYKQVIDASSAGENLISSMQAARLARHADSLVHTYDIDIMSSEFDLHHETNTFKQWYHEVEHSIANQHYVTMGRLVNELITFIDDGKVPIPGTVALIGFADFTPQEQRLIQALKRGGATLTSVSLEATDSSVSFRRFSKTQDNYLAAARWAHDVLTQASTEDSPPRLALVVHNTDAVREPLSRALTDVLSPQNDYTKHATQYIPWRFMLAPHLTDIPVIQAAMDIAQWHEFTLPLDHISRILLSPFIGHPNDKRAHAKLDFALREQGSRQTTLNNIIFQINRLQLPDKIAEPFLALKADLDETQPKQLPSGWAQILRNRLKLFSWNTHQTDSSIQTQYNQAFDDCLQSFASMDAQLGAISGGRMAAWLREVLYAQRFQPRTAYQPPIEIIDLNEVGGLKYDHVFIVNLTADHLPMNQQINPFIPLVLQRQSEVPGAIATGTHAKDKGIYEHLRCMGSNVVFSVSTIDEQGANIIPCPFVTDWPAEPENLHENFFTKRETPTLPAKDNLPTISEVPNGVIKGGSSIIKNAMISPFVAFCRHRLHLQAFPETGHGIDRRMQGIIIHEVMDVIWKTLKDQTTLINRLKTDITPWIHEVVISVMQSHEVTFGIRRYPRLFDLEVNRIVQLVLTSLEKDAERTFPFEVIAQEKNLIGDYLGLPIKLMLDRIEKVHTQHEVKFIINDYKTGKVKPNPWQKDKLVDPQLPLYALMADADENLPIIDGIVLTYLNDDKKTFEVLSNFTKDLCATNNDVDLSASWADHKAVWNQVIAESVTAFQSGSAALSQNVMRDKHEYDDLQSLYRLRSLADVDAESILDELFT